MSTSIQNHQRIRSNSRKKSRQRRTVKNAIVRVDDVFAASGLQNANWLPIAKKKLTDRELAILRNRQQKMDQIIISTIRQFICDHKNTFNFGDCLNIYDKEIRYNLINPQSAIMSLCAQSIANTLCKWKGYKTKKNTPIRLFRDYFKHCRHWFDTKKIQIIAINFWIPSMQLIRQYANKATTELFGEQDRAFQNAFGIYFYVMILKAVFEGEMKPANTRNVWLIPAMSYRAFLKRYNRTLNIAIRTRSTNKNKVIRREYVQSIRSKHDTLRDVFHSKLNGYVVRSSTLSPHDSSVNRSPLAYPTMHYAESPPIVDTDGYSHSIASPLWRAPSTIPNPMNPLSLNNEAQMNSNNQRWFPSYPVNPNQNSNVPFQNRYNASFECAPNPSNVPREQAYTPSIDYPQYPVNHAPIAPIAATGPPRRAFTSAPCRYCCDCCYCRTFGHQNTMQFN
eukprot:566374_1